MERQDAHVGVQLAPAGRRNLEAEGEEARVGEGEEVCEALFEEGLVGGGVRGWQAVEG